jgi:benzoyl-CoA reductase subunit C
MHLDFVRSSLLASVDSLYGAEIRAEKRIRTMMKATEGQNAGQANGLATAEKYYREYGLRAKELHRQGQSIMGYLSALGPVEVITAAGLVPLRLKGDVSESITKADAHMETIVCPFVRNVFDAVLKGTYEYLDGIVIPHLCDSTSRTYDTWAYNVPFPYSFFLNVPHASDQPSIDFFKSVLGTFMKSLEKFTGKSITHEALAQSVKAHNQNRQVMRQLYALRQANPPLISGVEMTHVLVAAMGLPVNESTQLIVSVIDEVKARAPKAKGTDSARIMILGDQIDNTAMVEIVENAGAWVVMDDVSIGAKIYWRDADETKNPLDGIAERYLRKIPLPTTLVGAGRAYQESLEDRFGHIRGYVKDFSVDGAILFIYKYCDPYGFEVPAMKSYIEALNVPVLYLEDEYSTSTMGRLKTRIEAFLEMIA